MTSTNVNVGLDATSRMTSRVLKPPGGGHTDIFGASEPEPPRPRRHQTSSIVLGNENEKQEKATNGVSTDQVEHKEISGNEPGPEKHEAKPDAAAEPARTEPPRRVRVPPGGFSSGLW